MTDQRTPLAEQGRQPFGARAADCLANHQRNSHLPHLPGRMSISVAVVCGQGSPGSRGLDLGRSIGDPAREGMQVMACDICPAMLDQAIERDLGSSDHSIQLEPDWRVLPPDITAMDAVVGSRLLQYADSLARRAPTTGTSAQCSLLRLCACERAVDDRPVEAMWP